VLLQRSKAAGIDPGIEIMRAYILFSSCAFKVTAARLAAVFWLINISGLTGAEPPLLLKSQENPRYFSDGTRAVYLTGQHIPTGLNDWGRLAHHQLHRFHRQYGGKKS